MNKFTAVAIAIIVLCFGGLIMWSINNNTSSIDVSGYDPQTIIEATDVNGNIGDHVRGKSDSKVIVVE